MGYTHYWRSKPSLDPIIWDCFMQDVQKILDTTTIPLTNIEISKDKVTLNGVGEDGHEDLWITSSDHRLGTTLTPDIRFDFCKTAYKPYDTVVTAILLVYRFRFGKDNVSILSDGEPEEWRKGEELALKATGLALNAAYFVD